MAFSWSSGSSALALNALKEAGLAVTVFSDVQPDPSIDIVMAGMIVLGVNDEMTIMREEIFGPFLPSKPYRETEEVIGYVKGHDRPLAFYPFTNDKRLAQRYITEVLSGSVGVNEGIVQVGQHGLPFGGVGASGMGHYHGYEGFLTFRSFGRSFAKGASRRSRRRYSRPTESARSSPWTGCSGCEASARCHGSTS